MTWMRKMRRHHHFFFFFFSGSFFAICSAQTWRLNKFRIIQKHKIIYLLKVTAKTAIEREFKNSHRCTGKRSAKDGKVPAYLK